MKIIFQDACNPRNILLTVPSVNPMPVKVGDKIFILCKRTRHYEVIDTYLAFNLKWGFIPKIAQIIKVDDWRS